MVTKRSGGAYALRGFLYQLLGSALLLPTFNFPFGPPGADDDEATVVLEPAAGGDAIGYAGNAVEVVQYKLRGAGRWSDAEIIKIVLPDLVRAAPGRRPARFVLFTSAPDGRTADFIRLQRLLRQGPDKGLAQADREKLAFRISRSKTVGARAFFALALEACIPKRSAIMSSLPTPEHLAEVIAHFEVKGERTLEALMDGLNAKLGGMGFDRRRREVIYHAMVGYLAACAAEGEGVASARSLFDAAGVPLALAVRRSEFEFKLAGHLQGRLGQIHYRTSEDVRQLAAIPLCARPTVFCGRSGVGKSWMLARAAARCSTEGALCLWITGARSREAARKEVAELLASALGREEPLNAHALRAALDAAVGGAEPYRICVFLDQFETPQDASSMLEDPWWAEQSIEVAASFPAGSPESLGLLPAFQSIEVQPFDLYELRRFLTKSGVNFIGLPRDVLDLISLPILARLYADLAQENGGGYRPHSEYELVDAAWSRPPAGPRAAWLQVRTKLDRLLAKLWRQIEKGAPVAYPWPLSTTKFSPAQVELLERNGFLRWSDADHLAMDHDRLLAWGLAAAAAIRLTTVKGSLTSVLKLIPTFFQTGEREILPGNALGYLALDILWRLTRPNASGADVADELLKALFQTHEFDWSSLATLGPQAFGVARRYIDKASEHGLFRPHQAGEALAALAPLSLDADMRAWMETLRTRPYVDHRIAALKFYAARPQTAPLAALIDMWLAAFDAWRETHTGRRFAEEKAAYDAALAVARRYPKRLDAMIERATSPRALNIAVSLIFDLPPSLGRPLLSRHLSRARALHPQDRRRWLPYAFRLLPDRVGLKRLQRAAVRDSASFEALADAAPACALKLFASGAQDAQVTLPALGSLVRQQPEASAVLAARVESGQIPVPVLSASIGHWPGYATASLWRLLVGSVVSEGHEAGRSWGLHRLARAASFPLLSVLEGSQGKPLAALVARRAAALSRGRSDRNADLNLIDSIEVLIRTGGPSLDRFISARLSAPDEIERRAGLADALVSDDLAVRRGVLKAVRAQLKAPIGKVITHPFEVAAVIAPGAVRQIGLESLASVRRDGPWVAAEIALCLDDQPLGLKALAAIQARPASRSLYMEVRLLAAFSNDRKAKANAVRRALRTGEATNRYYAAFLARQLGDRQLLAAVAKALLRGTQKAASHDDANTIMLLAQDQHAGPALLEALRARSRNRLLEHVLSGVELPNDWARDPLFSQAAIGDAVQLDTNYLNTPRDGLVRLWAIDADLAFEVFEEGLRRGGRAYVGVAADAMKVSASRTIDIVLRQLTRVEDKVAADLCKALRAANDQAHLIKVLHRALETEDETARTGAIQVAGWLTEPSLAGALHRIRGEDTRRAMVKALDDAEDRSAVISFMDAVAAALAVEEGPTRRRRLLAILISADKELDLLARFGDPLFVGPMLRCPRERRLYFVRRKA